MLARLFIKGSLKNQPNGFSFQLKNIIDSGTVIGVGAITVDEQGYEPSQITLKIGETETPAISISRENPLYARSMAVIEVRVQAEPLAPGPHSLAMQIQTREAGRLQFTASDTLG
jgi:hypothetical protein